MTQEVGRQMVAELFSAHWPEMLMSVGILGVAAALTFWAAKFGEDIFQQLRILINVASVLIIGGVALIWVLFGEEVLKTVLLGVVFLLATPILVYFFVKERKGIFADLKREWNECPCFARFRK